MENDDYYSDLKRTMLRVLSDPNQDHRLGSGQHYLAEAIKKEFSRHPDPTPQIIHAQVWNLIIEGLAYIDFSQPTPDNWNLVLTNAGLAAAEDESFSPDIPHLYIKNLTKKIPGISELVIRYLWEALTAYTQRCYLASAVMLGVASEAAFLEMAGSFANWLKGAEADKFRSVINNGKTFYLTKFSEFRKRIEGKKPRLPEDLKDNMALTLDAVNDALRIYRNEAGHPTGKKYDRDEVFTNLQMVARYLGKIYAFKEFFDSGNINSEN